MSKKPEKIEDAIAVADRNPILPRDPDELAAVVAALRALVAVTTPDNPDAARLIAAGARVLRRVERAQRAVNEMLLAQVQAAFGGEGKS